jgi:hypothetical protein
MINVSQYFFDRTGGVATFIEVSMILKNGSQIVGSVSNIGGGVVMVFCPLQMASTPYGLKVAPYDFATDDLFVPIEASAIQSTSRLSSTWGKIWEKYAKEKCIAVPLTKTPEHKNYFLMDEVSTAFH